MRDLDAVVDHFSDWQWATFQLLPQGLALQQFGDQIGCAFECAKAVNSKNVGMVQGRGRLRLLLKSTQPIRILRDKRWQDFDRDFTFQNRVARAIDLTHSARTQQAENFIAIKFRARDQRHGEGDYSLHNKVMTKS